MISPRARRTRVKICGCTSEEDIGHAVDAGADAVGLILAPSERQLSLERAADLARSVPPLTALVAVVVDPSAQELLEGRRRLPGARWQFSGSESPQLCASVGTGYVKTFHLTEQADRAEAAAILAGLSGFPGSLPQFDTASSRGGGSGRRFAWERLSEGDLPHRFVVSGGLTPENVAECIRMLRPYAVDVRGGVEAGGRKDPLLLRAFIEEVGRADEEA